MEEQATKLSDNIYRENPTMTSVVSYPRRCSAWGNARYRGNCDGTLFKDLILWYKARRIADPMFGSGTTRDVCAGLKQLGHDITYWGSDLKQGFDLAVDPLPERNDFVWIHPPYWNMIQYNPGDPRCLSNAETYLSFTLKLSHCLKRCYDSLSPGGHLAVLVGDMRKGGVYFPIVRAVLNSESSLGALAAIIIKAQHNCMSDSKQYARLKHPRIAHEFCVLFEKPAN